MTTQNIHAIHPVSLRGEGTVFLVPLVLQGEQNGRCQTVVCQGHLAGALTLGEWGQSTMTQQGEQGD